MACESLDFNCDLMLSTLHFDSCIRSRRPTVQGIQQRKRRLGFANLLIFSERRLSSKRLGAIVSIYSDSAHPAECHSDHFCI